LFATDGEQTRGEPIPYDEIDSQFPRNQSGRRGRGLVREESDVLNFSSFKIKAREKDGGRLRSGQPKRKKGGDGRPGLEKKEGRPAETDEKEGGPQETTRLNI